MKKLVFSALIMAGLSATAQVKVGDNPTTLATDANFQVEATDGNQFFINKTNGNVGIGTSTPNRALDISSSQSFTVLQLRNSDDTYDVNGEGSAIRYCDASKNFKASIGYIYRTSITDSGLFLSSKDDIYIEVNGTARHTFKSDGKVGIGKLNPNHMLDVNGNVVADGGVGSDSRLSARGGTDGTIRTEVYSAGTSGFIGTSSNHPLNIRVNTQNAMRINTNTTVTIGNADATCKLDVRGYIRVGTSDSLGNIAPQAGMIRYVADTDSVTAGNQPKFQGYVGEPTNAWVDLHN